jgi:hypothetical protein
MLVATRLLLLMSGSLALAPASGEMRKQRRRGRWFRYDFEWSMPVAWPVGTRQPVPWAGPLSTAWADVSETVGQS